MRGQEDIGYSFHKTSTKKIMTSVLNVMPIHRTLMWKFVFAACQMKSFMLVYDH